MNSNSWLRCWQGKKESGNQRMYPEEELEVHRLPQVEKGIPEGHPLLVAERSTGQFQIRHSTGQVSRGHLHATVGMIPHGEVLPKHKHSTSKGAAPKEKERTGKKYWQPFQPRSQNRTRRKDLHLGLEGSKLDLRELVLEPWIWHQHTHIPRSSSSHIPFPLPCTSLRR